jgi:hypothetical protein
VFLILAIEIHGETVAMATEMPSAFSILVT